MKFLQKLISIFLITLLIFSSYKIIVKIIDYKKADNLYTELQSLKNNIPKDVVKDTTNNNIGADRSVADLSYINKDYRGWICVDNTNIDYPILQYTDNSYYIDKNINLNYSMSGSIFLDFRNNNFADKNTVIYGHNMKNNTMFANLQKFKDKTFFDENTNIYISTPDGNVLEYQVFSVYVIDSVDNYIQINFQTDNEYEDYLNKIINNSLFSRNIPVTKSDNILTLSTCSFEFTNARTVVHAKLIK